jgi:Zn ribbon nucleic-acid-binding protein
MDICCPYCDTEQDINHDDGFGYEEDIKHEMECVKCGKRFVFTTSTSFYYEAEKADCLNGEDHNYKLIHTSPKEFSKMRCEYCDDEREMTDQERIGFKIGTKVSTIL